MGDGVRDGVGGAFEGVRLISMLFGLSCFGLLSCVISATSIVISFRSSLGVEVPEGSSEASRLRR